MNFPTDQLRLYVLTRHKTGATTEDIIHEMTQVHGKDNVPSQNTVAIVGYKTLIMEVLSFRKEIQQVAVKMKLTRRKTMLVVAVT